MCLHFSANFILLNYSKWSAISFARANIAFHTKSGRSLPSKLWAKWYHPANPNSGSFPRNFALISCSVSSFRASKPITLTSLGFFGPACLPTTTSSSSSEGPVAYVVDIQIEQLKKACSSHTKSISLPVKVSRTETIFYVNFPTPLNILPGVWYKIKFRLNVSNKPLHKMSMEQKSWKKSFSKKHWKNFFNIYFPGTWHISWDTTSGPCLLVGWNYFRLFPRISANAPVEIHTTLHVA